MIKKWGSLEAANEAKKNQTPQNPPKKKKISPNDDSASNSVRGKKGKLKKKQRKYANQDDEDRELAISILQGGEKNYLDLDGSKKKKKKGGHTNKPAPLQSISQQKIEQATRDMLVKDSSSVAEKMDPDVLSVLKKTASVSEFECYSLEGVCR